MKDLKEKKEEVERPLLFKYQLPIIILVGKFGIPIIKRIKITKTASPQF